ncbi:MAG TPA: Yip1 family protein [Steroidobacteraceae bacterium]|nr:Yip1 family protein [Steroidobacteraceae bacterium]
MDFNKLIARVKGILVAPKTEWPVIAEEPTTVADLYKGYIVWLAAIPPLCAFLLTVRFSASLAVSQLIVTYALSLAVTFIVALIVDALAPSFGGAKNRVQALKTVAYCYTASWVAGIGVLVPFLSLLIMLVAAIYGVYLLYLGLPHTMKCPQDKAAGYTAVIIIVAILLSLLIGGVVAAVTGVGGYGRGGSLFGASRDSRDTTYDKDSTVGKLEQYAKQVEDASKKMEAAQKSGDQQAQAEAMKTMMGAALGGGDIEALAPDRLKPFLPESLGGLTRQTFSTQRNSAMGMQMTEARATYMGEDGRSLDLQITDTGTAKGLLALAGWAGIEGENETSTGYEKTYHDDGRLVHEQWDRSSSRGEYGVVLGERFTVKVEGQADDIGDLKAALADLDLDALEAMKGEGVKQN